MFHIDCPRFRGFMSWDELGCLARAVGFQPDLFKSNLTKHVTVEEYGMSVEQVNKMLDLRLLQQSIHRTRNLHTGEWNTKVIRKALYLMDHHAMTFEELYNTRIAYKAFEGNDMRGMMLDERIMLSALKMCGRSIAPLKMMHRIKHMSVNFEEPDRMQLFEFLDLVLWANLYEEFTFDSMERAEGKDGDLFRLVDFERLLSHHDKKLADKLNNEYLQEEWDFGQEKLVGDKSKFKEPPVVCGESRMQMESNISDELFDMFYTGAREQKLKYRYLKSELIHSHRKLYRAKAGYIRGRPVTAPDLSMYEEEEAAPPTPEFTAQTAYEIVNRKVKSANAAVGRTQPVLSDKPHIPTPQKIWTAKAVSDAELEETQKNYEQLKFDIETVQGRFDYQKNKEIEYYFPGQLERLTKLQEEKEESEAPDMFKKSSSRSKPKITQKEVDRLAYPMSRIPPSHAKICDARFRGWHSVKHKKGSHFVLVAQSFENSYTGRLKKKLVETCNAPVKKVKGDFVHRYTKKSDIDKPLEQAMRPYTAPANMQQGQGALENESNVSMTESPADSCKTVDTGYGSLEEKLDSSAENVEKISESEKSQINEQKQSFPKPFEKQLRKKASEDSEKNKEKKLLLDLSKSEKPKIYSGSEDTVRPKTSVERKNKETLKNAVDIREKTSLGANSSFTEGKLLSNSDSKSSQKGDVISQTVIKNGQLKNGSHKNMQNHNSEKQSSDRKMSEKSAEENALQNLNQNVEISLKVENYKKELNKFTTEKRNNQKRVIKSPPPLEFTFTSFVNNSEENDEICNDFTPIKEVTKSKSAWFEDDLSSLESLSPRMPEPTVYIKPKKEKIDIENLPIPHLEHSKPKTVHVGAIGKISLLESITESKFWEDMVEETSRSKKAEETLAETNRTMKTEETITEEEFDVSLKEHELTKDDNDDGESIESGVFEYETKPKSKSPKKKRITSESAIDEKLMKAKEDRLKRQKRVLKSTSNFQKMGIVNTSNRENKIRTSSVNSNKDVDSRRTSSINSYKDLDSGRKEKVSSKSTSNTKMKAKEDQNKINIEIMDKEKLNTSNNSKVEEKQKKFCTSMKRLVKRMDGSMSTDMRSKMLSTRLTCN